MIDQGPICAREVLAQAVLGMGVEGRAPWIWRSGLPDEIQIGFGVISCESSMRVQTIPGLKSVRLQMMVPEGRLHPFSHI